MMGKFLMGAAVLAAVAAISPASADGPKQKQEVDGAHVSVSAMWNESRDGVGRYQSPDGWVIESAVPVVVSEARSSAEVTVSADKHQASLSAHARGAGSFWDKKRGWYEGHLHIVLVPAS
jgi:hypothetical protein